MAATSTTTAKITGHNGFEHEVPYGAYQGIEHRARQRAIDRPPSTRRRVSFNRAVAAEREREITLEILGRGGSIAPTE